MLICRQTIPMRKTIGVEPRGLMGNGQAEGERSLLRALRRGFSLSPIATQEYLRLRRRALKVLPIREHGGIIL